MIIIHIPHRSIITANHHAIHPRELTRASVSQLTVYSRHWHYVSDYWREGRKALSSPLEILELAMADENDLNIPSSSTSNPPQVADETTPFDNEELNETLCAFAKTYNLTAQNVKNIIFVSYPFGSGILRLHAGV
jgi:hypothetical protein